MRRILLMVLGLAFAGFASADSLPPVTASDYVQGKADAPVTVIEYFSLDCPHCAKWEQDVFPKVKADFIDTGKIRFVMRDFPLHGVSLQAALLAHCDPDEYAAFVDTLFQSQLAWVPLKQGDDPMIELGKIAKLGGISEARFKACEDDKKLSESIVSSRAGGEAAGVTGTPHFFFNGKGQNGELTYDQFAKLARDAGA
ncbi:MAG TPA: DsbA family protein [Stellaceae bacterium]|nr:DsbA family protein [Stellaceae bacterium]